jgi:hypothetical protein
MANTNLPIAEISRAGVAQTQVTGVPANHHTFNNDGKIFVEATNSNTGSTARTVSLTIQKTVDGVTPAVKTVSIAAGATKKIGPFPTDVYNIRGGADDGLIYIDVDNAELLLQAWRLSPA